MACTGQAASRFGATHAALYQVGRSKSGHLDSPSCRFLPTGWSHEGTISMLSARRRGRKDKHPNAEARLPDSPQFGRQSPKQLRAAPSLQSRGAGAGRRCNCQAAAGPDKMCRDQVNVPLEIVSPEDSQAERVKVTLLGAKGSQQVIEVPTDVYILDSAIENNIDLPWSCRGGICGTCVGKVVKGSVDQSDISDLEFVLDEEYIKGGMALLCMARPNEDCTIETQSDWGYLMGFQDWKGASGNIGESVAADWKSISDV